MARITNPPLTRAHTHTQHQPFSLYSRRYLNFGAGRRRLTSAFAGSYTGIRKAEKSVGGPPSVPADDSSWPTPPARASYYGQGHLAARAAERGGGFVGSSGSKRRNTRAIPVDAGAEHFHTPGGFGPRLNLPPHTAITARSPPCRGPYIHMYQKRSKPTPTEF